LLKATAALEKEEEEEEEVRERAGGIPSSSRDGQLPQHDTR